MGRNRRLKTFFPGFSYCSCSSLTGLPRARPAAMIAPVLVPAM
jgi:hypothetical protein